MFTLFVSLYKVLLGVLQEPIWQTLSACLIVLDNLCEVFGCSIIIESTMFGFSNVFGA